MTSYTGYLHQFDNFELVDKKKCSYDLEITSKNISMSRIMDLDLVIVMKNSKDAATACLPESTILKVQVQTAPKAMLIDFSEKIKNFTAVVSLIMMILVYNTADEMEKLNMAFQRRMQNVESHGQRHISYASMLSLWSTCLLFVFNFAIFMIYFSLSMVGWSFSFPFQLPLILQFVILFFFCNRMLIIQLKILAMDRYEDMQF